MICSLFQLSVSDAEEEGKWKDFYTGELMQHKGPFRGPAESESENYAHQLSEGNWTARDMVPFVLAVL